MFETDDAALMVHVRAAQAGNPGAFGSIMNELGPRLLMFVRRVGGRAIRADADENDLVQETFALVFKSVGDFEYRGEGSFYRWVAAHARNVISNRNQYLAAKGRGATRHTGSFTGLQRTLPEPLAKDPTPSSTAGRRERLAKMQEKIAILPPTLREAFELSALEGLSLSEIAEHMGTKKTTAFDRLHKARTILREELGPGPH